MNRIKKIKIISILILIISVFLSFNFRDKKIIKVEANPKKGFNYEYYLYIPKEINNASKNFLLVEPNNTGIVSDNHKIHLEKVENLLKSYSMRIANSLKTPLLIPVFDRPESNIKMYTHSLDSDTIKNNDGKLARIDLQLINMIEDAQNKLKSKNIIVEKKIFMNGFSASGSFVNRFAVLYPEMIKAISTGGINGMPILPIKEFEGLKLPFHIGVDEIERITGNSFDIEEYKKVAQYIYMGELDENDTLPYDDAFNDNEREIVIKVLGIDMKDRWKKSEEIYGKLKINAYFKTYSNTGHSISQEIEKDIINFFEINKN